ncbi:hypothetical protein M513_14338 [Trichuris suis]|uniref:Uncharacterized protein n=1 Tax=Trichuris suis TaxID=68888 RepID=A0A085LII9_9BILA|nr:hypothetical protein M513_14338 [Trichuris suis]
MKNTLLFLLTMCKHDITTGRKTAHIRNRWMEERKRTNAFLFFGTYERKVITIQCYHFSLPSCR